MGLRGVAPTGTRGGSPSNIAPFRGKGFGDRDREFTLFLKIEFFKKLSDCQSAQKDRLK